MTITDQSCIERFDLTGRVVIITGGAGLLGKKHAEAILQAGGTVILWDLNKRNLDTAEEEFYELRIRVMTLTCDITQRESIQGALRKAVQRFNRVDGLINNAANDPKVGSNKQSKALMRFENLPVEMWRADLSVGLTGAFLCSQVVGQYMAENDGGCILNIASDLALIGPDQRIYREEGVPEALQPAKPVTYSVVKSGLIGLTRYIATYWAIRGSCQCVMSRWGLQWTG